MLRLHRLPATLRAIQGQTITHTRQQVSIHRRLVTSAQKRALDKSQLSSSSSSGKDTTATTAAADAGVPKVAGGPKLSNVPLLLGALAVVGGGVVYMKPELWDQVMGKDGDGGQVKEEVEVGVEEKSKGESVVVVEESNDVADVVVEERRGVTVEDMAAIGIPANPARMMGLQNKPAAVFEKIEGNRVTVEGMIDASASTDVGEKDQEVVVVEKVADAVVEDDNVVKDSETVQYKPTVMDAVAEVFSSDMEKSAIELAQLRAETLSLDIAQKGELDNIDELTPTELKVKIIRLIAALSDSARHEAMRLKEYAAVAEKQTADKYIEILQKQRIEFEGELATQLRDKEDALKREFLEKERATKDQYEATIQAQFEAQNDEFKQKWNKQSEDLTKSLNERLEVALADGIAKNKAEMLSKLGKKVSEMEELSKQLESLRQKASISASFERGSQEAHRLSAASLALANKFETSQSAVAEMATLKAIISDKEGPITAALEKIPSYAITGVPTLPELQATFESVKNSCRQAAMVPEGSGLGGQILGYALSSVSIPPPAGLIEGDADENILSRAHYFVQIGDLERAVSQLNLLKGQASFVAKDWKEEALSRAVVDQAIRVIKMECALLNKNMSGSV